MIRRTCPTIGGRSTACGRKGLNFDDGTAMWEARSAGVAARRLRGGSEDAEAPTSRVLPLPRVTPRSHPLPHRKT